MLFNFIYKRLAKYFNDLENYRYQSLTEPTSLGPYTTLMLTGLGPYVINAW